MIHPDNCQNQFASCKRKGYSQDRARETQHLQLGEHLPDRRFMNYLYDDQAHAPDCTKSKTVHPTAPRATMRSTVSCGLPPAITGSRAVYSPISSTGRISRTAEGGTGQGQEGSCPPAQLPLQLTPAIDPPCHKRCPPSSHSPSFSASWPVHVHAAANPRDFQLAWVGPRRDWPLARLSVALPVLLLVHAPFQLRFPACPLQRRRPAGAAHKGRRSVARVALLPPEGDAVI